MAAAIEEWLAAALRIVAQYFDCRPHLPLNRPPARPPLSDSVEPGQHRCSGNQHRAAQELRSDLHWFPGVARLAEQPCRGSQDQHTERCPAMNPNQRGHGDPLPFLTCLFESLEGFESRAVSGHIAREVCR